MREKLMKILSVPIYPHELADPTEAVADYLLDNDVVPVVRCKDCKHWKFTDSLNPYWECKIFYDLHGNGYLTGADDFCSYGERKSNGENM